MNKSHFKIFILITAIVLALSVFAVYAEEYTYESEFARLPEEVKAIENIRLIDDHDEAVIVSSLGDNQSPNHLYGSSYFSGNSGGSLTLEFEGTLIGVLVEKGGFDIYIDDEFIESVGITAAPDKISQLVYFNDQLTNDRHTIRVVANKEKSQEVTNDTYSVFRGFIVQNEVEPIPTAVPTEVPEATPTPVPTATRPVEFDSTDSPDSKDNEAATLFLPIIIAAVIVIVIVIVIIVIITLKKKKK